MLTGGAADGRYARQLVLPELGAAGQARLAAGRVLVVGVGGLGCPVALALAGAGVGRLTLVDDDVVALHNLHRQPLYTEADVGLPKVEIARAALVARNPTVEVTAVRARLTAGTAAALVAGHDVVVDGTDTLPTRAALTDACTAAGVPLVYGSVARLEGQVSVFGLGDGPCWRCLFPELPPAALAPSCAEQGVLGVVPGLVGTWQAAEVLKLLAGIGTPLSGRLLHVDLATGAVHSFTMAARADCACRAPAAQAARTSWLEARSMTASPFAPIPQLTPEDVAAQLAGAAPPRLIDVREPWEHDRARIAQAELVPMRTIPDAIAPGGALADVPRDAALVIQCHHGGRSNQVAAFLAQQGFTNVANLDGGIDAWSLQVDPTVPRY
jgi:adenylyltransferase/sulfurtransferase